MEKIFGLDTDVKIDVHSAKLKVALTTGGHKHIWGV